MEQLISDALSTIINNSPVVAVLLLGIYHFKRSDDRKDLKIEQLIKGWNAERTERIDILEQHVVDCNTKHDQTQRKYEDLLMRVARLDEIEHQHHPEPDPTRRITKRVVLPPRRNPCDSEP